MLFFPCAFGAVPWAGVEIASVTDIDTLTAVVIEMKFKEKIRRNIYFTSDTGTFGLANANDVSQGVFFFLS